MGEEWGKRGRIAKSKNPGGRESKQGTLPPLTRTVKKQPLTAYNILNRIVNRQPLIAYNILTC